MKSINISLFILCFSWWLFGCEKQVPEGNLQMHKSRLVQAGANQIQSDIGHIFFTEDSVIIGFAHLQSVSVNSPLFAEREIDTLFTSIVITKDEEVTSDTLYLLDKYGGTYAGGVIDFQTGNHTHENFTGLHILIFGRDYFDAIYFTNEGKNVSDSIKIRWYPKKNRFEQFRIP